MITEHDIVELVVIEQSLVSKTSLFCSNRNRQRKPANSVNDTVNHVDSTDDLSI